MDATHATSNTFFANLFAARAAGRWERTDTCTDRLPPAEAGKTTKKK